MATIFTWIFKSYNKVYVIVTSVVMFFCYYLIVKNSKLKNNNENLNTQIKDLDIESKKIVTIQNEQAKIAARPFESRVAIHKWMRDLYDRSAKE
jgi:short subunit fatty acids transporter